MSTRHINPERLQRSPAFSQAVVVEPSTKRFYIGRQNGVDADGKVVGPTVGEQASQASATSPPSSRAKGPSLADIGHWTIAVVDGHAFDEGFAAFQQAWNPADPTAGHHGPRRRRSVLSGGMCPVSVTSANSCRQGGGHG